MRSKRCAAAVLGLLLSLSHMPSGRAFTVYVSNEKDNTISLIDSESLKVVDTLKVGQRPRGIILTKDGSRLLVCASDDDTIEVIDLATRKIVKTLPSGQGDYIRPRPAISNRVPTHVGPTAVLPAPLAATI